MEVFYHKDYPPLLKEIPTLPKQLFIEGNKDALFQELLIAVVGTRMMSVYGKQVLEAIIPPLVRARAVIVSGLAFGIDAKAHEIALDHGGRCVAVFGAGVDVIYPRAHLSLAKRILDQNGAFVSEYSPGTRARAIFFPARNRILSGLCKATVVIEAKEKSGSLITANFALEQNREVFAVPGSIFLENQKGTNILISKGAHPVLNGESILQELGILEPQKMLPLNFESSEEKLIFECLQEPCSLEEVVLATNLPLPEASQAISLMELKGMVKDYGGKRYAKV